MSHSSTTSEFPSQLTEQLVSIALRIEVGAGIVSPSPTAVELGLTNENATRQTDERSVEINGGVSV